MTMKDERRLVYTALMLVCGTVAVLLGIEAGIWTFVQMTVATELMYWLGSPFGGSRSPTSH